MVAIVALGVILSFQNCGKNQSGSSESSDTDVNTTQNLLAVESQSLSAGNNETCIDDSNRAFQITPTPSVSGSIRYLMRGTRVAASVLSVPKANDLVVDTFRVESNGSYTFVSSSFVPLSAQSQGPRRVTCRFVLTNFTYTFNTNGAYRFRVGGTPQMPSDLDNGLGVTSAIFRVVDQVPGYTAPPADTLNVSVVKLQTGQETEVFRLNDTMRITASASQRLAACATYESGDGCDRFPENYIFIDPPGAIGFNCARNPSGVACARTQAVRFGFATSGDYKIIFVNVGGYNRVLQRVQKFVRVIN